VVEVDVPSAAAVFGSHFLAHEAQQNFPVIRHRIIKTTNERQKREKKTYSTHATFQK
jgi:hypothetical protein